MNQPETTNHPFPPYVGWGFVVRGEYERARRLGAEAYCARCRGHRWCPHAAQVAKAQVEHRVYAIRMHIITTNALAAVTDVCVSYYVRRYEERRAK